MGGTTLRKWIHIASVACALGFVMPAVQAAPGERDIAIDVQSATSPLDRFYNFSVGSDYPGTLMREDSLAQLQTVKTSSVFAISVFTRSSMMCSARITKSTANRCTTGPASIISTTDC